MNLVSYYKGLIVKAISPLIRTKFVRKIKCAPFKRVLKNNLKIQDIHKDVSRCFIVGAGPSLKNLDTGKLENEVVIGINQAYLDPRIGSVKKKYWVLIDYFLMKEIPLDTLRAIENGVGEATYFLPVQAIPICQKYNLFEGKNKYYIYLSNLAEPSDRISDDQLDLSCGIIKPHGTAETAMICAVFMGLKRIHLIGVDSDWFAHKSQEGNHFYKVADNPHCVDNKIKYWINHNQMESKLHYGYLLYRSYRLLWEALQNRNIEVYNASGGGLLDVFPLVDYDTLFD